MEQQHGFARGRPRDIDRKMQFADCPGLRLWVHYRLPPIFQKMPQPARGGKDLLKRCALKVQAARDASQRCEPAFHAFGFEPFKDRYFYGG